MTRNPGFRPFLLTLFLLLAPGLSPAAPPAGILDLGAGHTLVPRASFTDSLGQTHLHMVHRYHGLRVWGSEVVLHRKGGRLIGFTPSPALPMKDATTPLARPLDLDLEPSVSLEQARNLLAGQLGVPADQLSFGAVERVIVPRYVAHMGPHGPGPANDARFHRHLAGFNLAYVLQPRVGEDQEPRDFLLDAHTGRLLEQFPLYRRLQPVRGKANSFQLNREVPLDLARDGAEYLLVDPTRGHGGPQGGNMVTDLERRNLDRSDWPGTPYRSDRDTWGDGQPEPAGASGQSASARTTAADAMYGLQATWDYFKKVHGRDGIDGMGTATSVRLHATNDDVDADNAWWNKNCFCVAIAEGRRMFPLVSLSTLGHELTHGVTEATANFEQEGEPSELDEATSDFFGVMVETYTLHGSGTRIGDQGADWKVSDFAPDGDRPPHRVIGRYLDKPSKGDGQDNWSEDIGQMDRYEGSGPLSRALYFLSNGAEAGPPTDPPGDHYAAALPDGMAGIGNDKTARIWYRALTTYLTPESGYHAARSAALRAAQDLYGRAEAAAVRKAFAAVSVGDATARAGELVPPAIVAAVKVEGGSLELEARLARNGRGRQPVLNEVDYFVDNVLVAAAFAPPFKVVLDTGLLLANGGHMLTASGFSPAGNEGTSLGVPFTLANPRQQLLADPGLEDGGAWQGDVAQVLATDYAGTEPHGLYRFARFENRQGWERLALFQPVQIPEHVQATLSLWTRVDSQETGTAVDTLTMALGEPADRSEPGWTPSPQVVLGTLGNLDARPGWVRHSYDLSAYAGRAGTILLQAEVHDGTGTVFRVDDITLVCSPLPADKAPAQQAPAKPPVPAT